jgi:predicted methyltransferase
LSRGFGTVAATALAAILSAAPTVGTGQASEPAERHFTYDPAAVAKAVTDPNRPVEDRLRDPSSRPAEVLAFAGVAPGMRVLDLNAASGYYTELLARVVGANGRVIAQNDPGALAMLGAEVFERRYGGDRLSNVEQLFVKVTEFTLPRGNLDAVWMSMVYHDTYWHSPSVDWGPVDQHALLTTLFAALAPGGVVLVLDHAAVSGTDPFESAKATHRIDPEVVRRDFAAAGFVLEAQTDLLRGRDDDRTLSVFDPAVKGRTDRFVMRFRRP